jgi:cytochrome c551/c552
MMAPSSLRHHAVASVLVCLALGAVTSSAFASDQERGRAIFGAKNCGRCHRPAGERSLGPALDKLARRQGAFELAGRLWNHTPAMFTLLHQEGIGWPVISEPEMADLMAYLQADAARDPVPDLFRGQVLLVQKGCLKCHRLRGEGGRVAPDLADRRPAYDAAPAWAATMWTHTPRMAAKALELGIVFPRFADDEMGHLVGYVRSVSGAR